MIHGDILQVKPHHLIQTISGSPDQTRVHFVGNLPFNISTRLLVDWLHMLSSNALNPLVPVDFTLIFQKEVGDVSF